MPIATDAANAVFPMVINHLHSVYDMLLRITAGLELQRAGKRSVGPLSPVAVAQVRTVFPTWRAGRLHRGTDAESREAWITIHNGEGGEMVLEKQAFDAWPAGC